MTETTDKHDKLGSQLKQLLLSNDTVEFTYTKKDGSERKAQGTWKFGLMEGWQPADVEGDEALKQKLSKNDDVVKYYDLDSHGWRQCRKDAVTSITLK